MLKSFFIPLSISLNSTAMKSKICGFYRLQPFTSFAHVYTFKSENKKISNQMWIK